MCEGACARACASSRQQEQNRTELGGAFFFRNGGEHPPARGSRVVNFRNPAPALTMDRLCMDGPRYSAVIRDLPWAPGNDVLGGLCPEVVYVALRWGLAARSS